MAFKKLVLLFPFTPYLDVNLKKDTGLFPIYFAKTYNIPTEIVSFDDNDSTKKNFYRGVIIRKLKLPKSFSFPLRLRKPIKFFIALLRLMKFAGIENKAISHIMLFHLSYFTIFYFFLFKILYPHIKIYIKLDMTYATAMNLIKTSNIFLKYFYYKIISRADLISVETKTVARLFYKKVFFSNIIYIPNGYDDDLVSLPCEKQKRCNTIITVGRLFSAPKNTELLLDILAEISLKHWNVRLIGPIESECRDTGAYIDSFFKKNPKLKGKIEFVGNIDDVKQLKQEYERANIFIQLSRWESFGLALLEAAMAGDYIITTDVGAARDVTDDGKFGFICPESKQNQQNMQVIKNATIKCLQDIIDNKIDIESKREDQKKYCYENYLMGNIVKNKYFQQYFEI